MHTGFMVKLQEIYSLFTAVHRNNLHGIFMISSLCSGNLQCLLHYLLVSLEIFTSFLHGTSETCKRGKIM